MLSPGLTFVGNLGFVLVLLWAVWRAPWWHLAHSEDTHILLATCVALLLVWSIRAGIAPGLDLHLVGATLTTLMFGWAFGLLAISLVLFGATLYGDGQWAAYGWNGLLLACLPVALTWLVLRSAERWLAANFFIYVFIPAFFGAALSILSVGAASTAFFLAVGAYPLERLVQDYAIYYLLLVFPEAFLTGALMTLFVVYRPTWVATFDDGRYLKNQ